MSNLGHCSCLWNESAIYADPIRKTNNARKFLFIYILFSMWYVIACISYGTLSRFVTFLVNYPTNLVLARYFSLLFLAECNFNFIILIIVFFLFFPWIILLCIFFCSFVSFILRCYFIFSSPPETILFFNSWGHFSNEIQIFIYVRFRREKKVVDFKRKVLRKPCALD